MTDFIKAIILGIVEGITEWLPVSSTGHMILVDEFLKLDVSAEFKEMFLVVIQLGAILAVVLLYFNRLFPLTAGTGNAKPLSFKPGVMLMWVKIFISCIPAAVVGILWDDEIDAYFYNWQTVAIMLIVVGGFFLIVEGRERQKPSHKIQSIEELSFKTAAFIGLFQLIAAVLPGTSRSGATIVGALLLGVSRVVAAEYTFFLAVPVMIGASGLKLLKFGFSYQATEVSILLIGLVMAFIVSVVAIKFLVGYIKNHDFMIFGWYRILLGVVVILYFSML
jgi:undecaprenyl-diphosphatase